MEIKFLYLKIIIMFINFINSIKFIITIVIIFIKFIVNFLIIIDFIRKENPIVFYF